VATLPRKARRNQQKSKNQTRGRARKAAQAPTITPPSRKKRRFLDQQARKRRRQRAREAKRRLEDVVNSIANPLHKLASAFTNAFTRPMWFRFIFIMLAVILTVGNRTILGILRTVGALAPGHPSSYHRVFSRGRWKGWNLARTLIRLILDICVPDGRVELVGDDTVDEHRGAKVYGKGCHRDPVRSTHSHTTFRWGHKWVVLSILVRVPWSKRRWALPVMVALYRPPQKGKKDAGRHKTPAVLMRQLVAVLMHWFPEREFSFAGDGGYGTHDLAKFAARHKKRLRLISRFYPDANLYQPPPATTGKKPRHRPRKKGAKLPSPATIVKRTNQRSRANVAWYGGGRRDIEIVSGTGYWYKSGQILVEVLWVFVHDCTGTHRDDYFFTTDVSMKPTEVIEAFTGRWSIETTFQELRAYLGLETTRGRCEPTVLRMAPCLFGLYSVVVLIYLQLPERARRVRAVDWEGKVDTTFSDAITAVRGWLWQEWVFPVLGFDGAFARLPRAFQRVLIGALAPAA
jgi:DDE superfamily endonuclease